MEQVAEKGDQLDLLRATKYIVHYFDKNGALRSGRLIRKIEKGSQKGMCIVKDWEGHRVVPDKVRNIECITE